MTIRSQTRISCALAAAAAMTLLLGACHSTDPDRRPASVPEAAAAASAEAAAADPPVDPAAVEDAAEETKKTYSNTVKWTTASELDNFGYDVYRGESPDGPFERVNPEVIEGAGTTDEPTRYRFVDDTIDPRKTYYYYVESISMAGVRERFTPIGEARPKIPPADDPGA